MRIISRALVALTLLAVLAGCSTPFDDAATPTPKIRPIRLQPPDFYLKGDSGKQKGINGAYFWQASDGTAAQINSGGFSLTDVKSLKVKTGKTAPIEITEGPNPDVLELKVYPRQGNVMDIPGSNPPATAFHPQTQPVASQQLQSAPYGWEVKVEPGSYFVLLHGTWQNPKNPQKPLEADIAFMVNVAK